MLRLLVVLLVLGNLAFYAWTRGSLDGLTSYRAQGDREPERLTRQVRPETLRVVSPASAVAMAAAASEAAVCLEAGPYTPAQIAAAEGVMQTVMPSGSWTTLKTDTPPVWIVYMGKYPNREQLQKKTEELRRLRVPFEEVHNVPELDQGLALGRRHDNRAAAETALAELVQRGVRTARVASLSPASSVHMLRVERADATLQARLSGLRAEAMQGKSFSPCARPS